MSLFHVPHICKQEVDEEVNEAESNQSAEGTAAATAQSEEDLMMQKFNRLKLRRRGKQIFVSN